VRKKLVIDADPGICDALAVAIALLEPELDVVALTAVPGRVSGEMALLNLQCVASTLDPPRWPRIGADEGRATDISPDAAFVDPIFLEGETGLGDCDSPRVGLHHRVDAAKLLVDTVRDQPNEVTILTLGPLTNLAAAEERSPGTLSSFQEIVILGGSLAVGGDVTPAAEFNIFSNPTAAQVVLASASTKTIVPLDVSLDVVFSFDQYQRLGIDATTRLGHLVEQTLPFALRAHRQYLGMEGVPLQAITALCAIVEPHLFKRRPLSVEVEVTGTHTRGSTLFDSRPRTDVQPNIDVLTSVDSQGVIDYFTRRLRAG